MTSRCYQCVCVSALSPLESLNQSVWNLICVSRYMVPSKRRISYIHLIGLCACMCVPLSFIGKDSMKNVTAQRKHMQQKNICWTSHFGCGPCSTKGNYANSSAEDPLFPLSGIWPFKLLTCVATWKPLIGHNLLYRAWTKRSLIYVLYICEL
jgi:hypothetical protein